MRLYKSADLRDLATKIRGFVQRAKTDGFDSAGVVTGAGLMGSRIARLFSDNIDAQRQTFSRAGFDDLPEPMQNAVEAASHAYDVLARFGNGPTYDPATATERLTRAAEQLEAAAADPTPGTATERQAETPGDDVADPATGFVNNPSDPSAYESISAIKDRWVARSVAQRDAERWLTDNPEIRWTRPGGHGRRRAIHVADAEHYLAFRLSRERGNERQATKPSPAKRRK